MGIGAYVTVLLASTLRCRSCPGDANRRWPRSWWAVATGLPVLRLSGIFLAIATIGFGQVVVGIILNIPATGEGQGLINIGASPTTAINYIFGALLVVTYLLSGG